MRPRRLTDIAYDAVRAGIGSGELAPGERLVEAQLAERLGMSAMPVRLALARLRDDGLVEGEPGRGARVAGALPGSPTGDGVGSPPGTPLQPAPFATLADVVADRIRAAIVAGRFRAGDRLVERELAAELGTSAVPVREALQRLQEEGLVERAQRRGGRVATMTPRDYAENATVVAALAGCALDEVFADDPEGFAAALAPLAERAGALAGTPARSEVFDCDAGLFDLLGAMAGNDLLRRLLPRLRSRATAIQPSGPAPAFDAERARAWADGVAALARAAASREQVAAAAALRQVVEALLPPDDGAVGDGAPSPRRSPRRPARPARTALRLDLWGSQEAPGLLRWVEAIARAFEEREGSAVASRQVDIAEVAGYRTHRIVTAADVCFAWNGLYHLEAAWEGDLLPLERLVDRERLEASGATRQSVFQGHHYRFGWFAVGIGLAVNRELLARAGLDADDDALARLDLELACERLASAGVLPLTIGADDTYVSEWLFSLLLVQQTESERDVHDLVLGRRPWADTRFGAAWEAIRRLERRGYLPEEAARWSTRRALQLFLDRRAGMTLLNSAALPELYERLGPANVAFVPFPPLAASGRHAGCLVMDSQGLAVPARAHQPELAARFLDLAGQADWVERMWSLAHQVPASRLLDPSVIADPQRRRLYETWRQGEHAPFVGNLIPRAVRQRVLGSTLRGVLTGALPAAEVPRRMERACARWRRDHPAAAASYHEWAASFPARA